MHKNTGWVSYNFSVLEELIPAQNSQEEKSHLNFKWHSLNICSHHNKLFDVSSGSHKIFGHYPYCILK